MSTLHRGFRRRDQLAGLDVLMGRRRPFHRTRTTARAIGHTAMLGGRVGFRYRAALAPWMVATAVAVTVAVSQRTAHPTVVGFGVATVVAVAAVAVADRMVGERSRVVATTGLATTAVWVAVAAVAGTDWRPVRVAAVLIFVTVAAPWWSIYRVRTITGLVVQVAGLAAIWQLRLSKVAPGTEVHTESTITLSGEVVGRRGIIEVTGDDADLTTTDLIARTEKITARLKLPIGQVVVDVPEDGRADRAALMMFYTNPLRQPQVWPGCDLVVDEGTSSIGIRMDGTLAGYVWSVPDYGAWHDLICGTTGAGKSKLITMLLATSRAADGAIVDWVGDPQGGQSAPDWVDQVDRFARTGEECLVLLQQALKLMYDRNDRLARWEWTDKKGRQRKGFDYFPWMRVGLPLLVITIFEAHAVLNLPGARLVVEELAKMARKCGIKLRLEVQVPLLDQLGGSTTIRDMVVSGNVVVFRTANRLSGQVAFNGALPVDPVGIPKAFPGKEPIKERVTAGLGFVLGGEASAMMLRAWLIEDSLDYALAGQTWHVDAHEQGVAGQWPPTPEDVIAAATALTVAAADPETPAEAGTTRELILAALVENGGAMLRNDLIKATGRSKSGVHKEISKLISTNGITELTDGRVQAKETIPA